jgi:signal transduction histidine kinase/CheY-like chemotaxis protein/HPt (histidine-containing phosphotransfer) domain-containing protein
MSDLPGKRQKEDSTQNHGLLASEQATRADMAVALEMLRQGETLLDDQIKDRVKTEDQFRFLLETSPIAVAIFTFGDYKILFANHQYMQMLSLKETLVSTAHPKALFSDPDEFDSIMNRLRSDEKVTDALVQLGSFSGEKRWSQSAFLRIKFQSMDCVLSWFYDVTEMRRARELAEKAADVKTNLLANLSHEIRTPMNAIIGLSQLALSPEVSEGERVVSLKKILSASKNLVQILNDVLDFSKMEAGKVVIEKTPFSLKGLVEELQSLFSASAREKGLNFEVAIAPDAPLSVIGDSLRLNQILSNLLSNAIKFTEHGKVTFVVQLKAMAASRVKVLFSVRDTGIGIPNEKQQHLFQAFNQLDARATRRFGGSGLGLAISKSLLQLMESDFRIESALGSGSTFSFEIWFDLPFSFSSKVNLAGSPNCSSMSGLRSIEHCLRGKHILVAEDDLLNQEVVGQFLRISGATVEFSSTGEETLALLEKRHFDAVLMDMHMPDMSGIDATRAIRKIDRFRFLPILALTAAVTSEDRERCYGSGMNDFVPKPIDPDELVNKLAYWTSVESEADSAAITPKVVLDGFDLTNLRRIMSDEKAMIHLLKRFCNHNVDSLIQIKAAIDAQQINTAERLVHKLKGTVGNLGAMDLYGVATRLDNELKAGHCASETWSEFEKIFVHTLNEIVRLE